MKNIKSKLFAVSVSAMSVAPLLTSCMPSNVTSKLASNVIELKGSSDNETTKREACTVTYVGKDVSETGCPIAARATDCNPKAVHLKLKHYKANELANKTVKGKLGMEYTFPANTLAYTSCPLSDKTSDDPTWASGMWENNGINEKGVGVSATLTCSTAGKFVGWTDKDKTKHEPAFEGETFLENGVGEELLPMIMAAQATSAKHAMEIAAEAIDRLGAQDANIIFAVDKNEAWLMEIYTRHQYCAIKLPDNKAFVAGNEFILDSIGDLGYTYADKGTKFIVSKGLFSVPEQHGLAIYKDGTTPTTEEEKLLKLNLFQTYAEEGVNGKEQHTIDPEIGEVPDTQFSPRCHMRTYRGYSLFDRTVGVGTGDKYQKNKKYEPFLTPKNEDGSARKLKVDDVIGVYRDEFDELVETGNTRFDQTYYDTKTNDPSNWRTIAVETTRAIHIMSSDASKPDWIAANEWYTPSSGNYVPFLQINNAMESVEGEYGYYPDRFEFDENCSAVLFRELNKLAWYDREHYGMPLQQFWRAFEQIYNKQMDQVVKEASQLTSIADAKNIVTNFNKHVRDTYISQVKKTKNDLLWHIMDQPQPAPEPGKEDKRIFHPLIDLETYVKELGWTNYHFDGKKATFERNNNKVTYTISDGAIYSKGNLVLNDSTTKQLRDSVENGKLYVEMSILNEVILNLSETRKININDYLIKSSVSPLAWIIPVTIVGAGGLAALVTCLLLRKKKQAKVSTKHK